MTEPKPYIELADFPALTPFTSAAIRAYMQRGEIVEGVHYFRHGRRVVFKWSAIADWIEKRAAEFAAPDSVDQARDVVPLRRRA